MTGNNNRLHGYSNEPEQLEELSATNSNRLYGYSNEPDLERPVNCFNIV